MVMSINTHGQPGKDEYEAKLRKQVEDLNSKTIVRPCLQNMANECDQWHYELRDSEIHLIHKAHAISHE